MHLKVEKLLLRNNSNCKIGFGFEILTAAEGIIIIA